MNTHHFSLVVAMALVLGVARGAAAQEPAPDLARLQAEAKPGDTLFATDTTGRQLKWKLANLPAELLIRQAGLATTDLKEVALERADSPWNGLLIGLAAVGTPWLIVCALNDWCYYNEYGAENLLRTTAVTTAVIGAGIGALVDLSIRERITLYQGPSERPLNVSMVPVLLRPGAMVQVSARF